MSKKNFNSQLFHCPILRTLCNIDSKMMYFIYIVEKQIENIYDLPVSIVPQKSRHNPIHYDVVDNPLYRSSRAVTKNVEVDANNVQATGHFVIANAKTRIEENVDINRVNTSAAKHPYEQVDMFIV